IKENLGNKKSKNVEEKRVKPTVIRRRKKRIQKAHDHVEDVLKSETRPEITVLPGEVPSQKPVEKEEEVIAEKVAAEVEPKEVEPKEMAAEKVIAEAEPKEEEKKLQEQKKSETIHEPATVVEPPPLAETPKVEQEQPKSDLKKPSPVKKEKPAEQIIKKQPKKRKKHFVAKIIKLPETPVVKPEPEVQKVQDKEAKRKPAARTRIIKKPPEKRISPIKEKAEKDQRISKQPQERKEDRDSLKKKGSFRRKAVVEGKALYDKNRTRGRKGRKGRRGAKIKPQTGQKTLITTPKAIKRRIKIDDTILLSELAKRMGIKTNEMIQKLMTMGVMATVNQTIDYETAALLASEFGYELERASFEEETILHVKKDEAAGKLIERPPVVTIMGHVDHGKTSLLDVIRKSSITAMEAGGITQHIGAYNVSTDKGQIAFIDTPGHEAFTSMRARGAKVTDIVVLVVAADDGVMPQTIEAINHSKAAEVPIIVAVNKIDKPDADPERVKRELSDHGIVAEDWGGDTIFVNVSAKQNIGIADLLDMILLQTDVMELKANPDRAAMGHVIEAKLDSGRGPVATVLIQEGTLHTGDALVCGIYYGKIRAMLNDKGMHIDKAGPSVPVEVLGLSGVPNAGDEFIVIEDEKSAKQVSLHRVQKQRAKELAKSSRLSLEGLYAQLQAGEIKDLNLIIKADVHGSIEALKDSLAKISSDEVKINVIHSATGTITESDISLAAVSDAIIIGFNVRPSAKIHEMADEEGVDMRFYDIIYNAIKEIKDAMVGMMSPTFKEHILGRAEVREVFVIPKKGSIAGSRVTDGKIERGRLVRLVRDGVVIYDGKIASLRRFKEDAKEVLSGYECGIGLESYNDIKIGDVLECYYLEEIKPTL
ncbi:MAG: translation initiation factor IF-2, partial [Deltaproteobacteria bacterium]|nr:translation initiation factor IF-2 [Deltaproteobacteria bacterium]